MARYQVILAYDGTDFQGFQRQANTRTVQGVVETALAGLGWQGRTILLAGRTDSGVHGAGQVIAFDLEWLHSPDELGRAINAHLPADVAVQSVQEAAAHFHPRFDAKGRTYQYHIYCEANRDPLRDRFAWRVWPEIDPELLPPAARLLTGIHDFSAFGTPPRPGGNTIREVYRAHWEPQAGGLLFEVSANAFLYHMVRRMVYLQVQIGQRRLELEQLAQAVHAAQPQPPGLAPAQGLVLIKVQYERFSDFQGDRVENPGTSETENA
jgi:tRNA pseudouridine38-40 synthase